MKNQNMVNLLSKVSLITSSIEDHVNRRFNRILVGNSLIASCSVSPKTSHSSSSAESGLTGGSSSAEMIAMGNGGNADCGGGGGGGIDSNDDDLSDDGLDYSQKFCDHNQMNGAEFNDDVFIGLTPFI